MIMEREAIVAILATVAFVSLLAIVTMISRKPSRKKGGDLCAQWAATLVLLGTAVAILSQYYDVHLHSTT